MSTIYEFLLCVYIIVVLPQDNSSSTLKTEVTYSSETSARP